MVKFRGGIYLSADVQNLPRSGDRKPQVMKQLLLKILHGRISDTSTTSVVLSCKSTLNNISIKEKKLFV